MCCMALRYVRANGKGVIRSSQKINSFIGAAFEAIVAGKGRQMAFYAIFLPVKLSSVLGCFINLIRSNAGG